MAKKKNKAARSALRKNAPAGVRKALAKRTAKSAKKSASKSRWTAPGAKDRARAAKAATREPKQAPLIKGLRIRALDNVCAHISDTRAAIARLQGEEADLETHAHSLLKKHDQMSWQFAQVAIMRQPGEEKLIVRTLRSRGPAPTVEPETPAAGEEETGPAEPIEPDAGGSVDEESAEGSLTH